MSNVIRFHSHRKKYTFNAVVKRTYSMPCCSVLCCVSMCIVDRGTSKALHWRYFEDLLNKGILPSDLFAVANVCVCVWWLYMCVEKLALYWRGYHVKGSERIKSSRTSIHTATTTSQFNVSYNSSNEISRTKAEFFTFFPVFCCIDKRDSCLIFVHFVSVHYLCKHLFEKNKTKINRPNFQFPVNFHLNVFHYQMA